MTAFIKPLSLYWKYDCLPAHCIVVVQLEGYHGAAEEREVWLGEGFCLLCPGGAGSLLTATRQHCFHATAALCSAQGAQLHIALGIGHYTIDTV